MSYIEGGGASLNMCDMPNRLGDIQEEHPAEKMRVCRDMADRRGDDGARNRDGVHNEAEPSTYATYSDK